MREALLICISLFFLCLPAAAQQEAPVQVQVTVLPAENAPPPPPPPENAARILVENLILSKENALPGENVTVRVGVRNVGTAAGQHTVVLRVDNTPVENRVVSLAANESAVVTFTISIAQVGAHTVSVDNLSAVLNILGEAQFRLENMSVSKQTVRPGEEFSVEVWVLNVGAAAGSYNVILRVDGAQVDNRLVELEAGRSRQVSFSLSIRQVGPHVVSVDGLSRTVTVSEEVPEFVVENLRLSKQKARPGEEITVYVDVANVGTASGSYTLVLKVDGAEVVSRTVSLAAGDRATVSFVISVEEVGEHAISADGLSGSLLVERPGPGLPVAPVIAVIAVIIAALAILLIFRPF